MSKPIKITTDSTADLSPELIEKYNISITPLHIEMDGKSYSDGVDATPEDLFSYYDRTGKLAKSSAVAMGEYLDFFKKLTEKGYDVIHVNIGSFLSSSYQNACLAAEETEGVYVINSKNLSSGTGHIALLAAELAAKGLSAKEIAEQCEEAVERLDVSFIIETLDYLHAGGRVLRSRQIRCQHVKAPSQHYCGKQSDGRGEKIPRKNSRLLSSVHKRTDRRSIRRGSRSHFLHPFENEPRAR